VAAPKPADICVRNNVHWYEAIFRTHGLSGTIVDGVWLSRDGVPPYYSNAMTIVRSPIERQLVVLRDLASVVRGPWAIKDSFSALDLAPLGFDPLFDAQWIWRDPSAPSGDAGDVRWHQVTNTMELDRWESAWRDNGSPADRRVFMPRLLDDPTIALFGAYRGDALVAGCAANVSSDAVGFSNFFVAHGDVDTITAGAVTAVGNFGAGMPIVGYAAGDALGRAKRIGFRGVGPLRIWATIGT
jgi:hypothetical protein